MESVIDEIKRVARLIHRDVERGEPAALRRVRVLRELRELDEDTLRSTIQRRHCLSAVARELGLASWGQLSQVCEHSDTTDFGALLYPGSCGGHWNVWSASYQEAREIRAQHGGYLLPYRHQFFIVDRHFIADLGVDPDDPSWHRIGRDWVRPDDPAARFQLCQQVLRARLSSMRAATTAEARTE